MTHILYLAIGIVMALAFCIMPTEIIESIYRPQGFSDELYNNSLYTPIALIILAISWASAAVYYYVINSVKFDRWMHWLIQLMLTAIAGFAACYGFMLSQMRSLNLGYQSECFMAGLVDAAIVIVMYVIASYSIRWWSSNCRHTHIPQ